MASGLSKGIRPKRSEAPVSGRAPGPSLQQGRHRRGVAVRRGLVERGVRKEGVERANAPRLKAMMRAWVGVGATAVSLGGLR